MLRQASFQFQIGSIKSEGQAACHYLLFQFQFQIGSIKSKDAPRRLYDVVKFQFQIGSIKRGASIPHCRGFEIAFQFQIGSIKRSCPITQQTKRVSFNSKLVRLKDQTVIVNRVFRLKFQFQIGSIKSRNEGGFA